MATITRKQSIQFLRGKAADKRSALDLLSGITGLLEGEPAVILYGSEDTGYKSVFRIGGTSTIFDGSEDIQSSIESAKTELKNRLDKVTSGIPVQGNKFITGITYAADGTPTATYGEAVLDTVKGVSEGDKLLSVDPGTKLLSSTLKLNYNSDRHIIQILGKGDEEISHIDASAFIKDGMIQEASYDNGFISLTFNTDGPKEPIKIDVSKLIDTYRAGDGLELDSITNTFKVKVRETNGFLSVGKDGLTFNSTQITNITDILGTKEDLSTKDTAFGRIKKLEESVGQSIKTILGTEGQIKVTTSGNNVTLSLADNLVIDGGSIQA